jgi:transketolase
MIKGEEINKILEQSKGRSLSEKLAYVPIYDDNKKLFRELELKAAAVRKLMIEVLGQVPGGHPGGSLSSVEILVSLYFHFLKINPSEPNWAERDRFILSKGHAAIAYYTVLALRGYFEVNELLTYDQLNSRLQGHPDMLLTPGVDFSTGSLGQGLSAGIGMAMGARMKGLTSRVYVILGDGEVNEGQIWEAAMTAAKYKVNNITAYIDLNGIQGRRVSEVMPSLEPLAEKWRAFGWNVIEIDGHDIQSIIYSTRMTIIEQDRPSIIIAKTVKGKGVSFMEDNPEWHSGKLSGNKYEKALDEVYENFPYQILK